MFVKEGLKLLVVKFKTSNCQSRAANRKTNTQKNEHQRGCCFACCMQLIETSKLEAHARRIHPKDNIYHPWKNFPLRN